MAFNPVSHAAKAPLKDDPLPDIPFSPKKSSFQIGASDINAPEWFEGVFEKYSERFFRAPPEFHGWPHEDPRQFLIDFDKVAKANHWSTLPRCLEIMYSCLHGFAEEWFIDFMDNEPDIKYLCKKAGEPFKSFEDYFLKAFLTDDLVRGFRNQVLDRMQTKDESCMDYYAGKMDLIRKADHQNNWDEKTRIKLIIEGLNSQFFEFVDLRNPQTYTDLREVLRRADIRNQYSGTTVERLESEIKEIHEADLAAKAKGLTPPSVRTHAVNEFPLILDPLKNIRSFDIKKAAWNTTMSIPLPQLLYHSPDLFHDFMSSMGINNPTKKVGNVAAVTVLEDAYFEEPKNKIFDTSVVTVKPIDLIMIPLLVNDTLIEVKLNPGALVSVVPRHATSRTKFD